MTCPDKQQKMHKGAYYDDDDDDDDDDDGQLVQQDGILKQNGVEK